MTDIECVQFLQWVLPQLQLRWLGFRKVHKQVCKRIARRIGELGLPSLQAYRYHLRDNRDEWRADAGWPLPRQCFPLLP